MKLCRSLARIVDGLSKDQIHLALEAFQVEQQMELEALREKQRERIRLASSARRPLTATELEADRELCEMMGLKPEELSDERFEELKQLWA